jgi:large subunit ribosomal protein L25
MEHIAIEARPRASTTKGEQKRQRRMGHIPAAVFGRGMDPVLVSVEARDLARVLQSDAGVNTLIDLSVNGARHLVKLAEVELDPIARTFLHVGLHKIQANELGRATIPIEIVGEPEAVRIGEALLEPGTSTVDVKCLPEDLVSAFTLDVSDMKVGDVRTIGDLTVPDRIEVMSAPDTAIVSLHVLRAMVDEDAETTPADADGGGDTGGDSGADTGA